MHVSTSVTAGKTCDTIMRIIGGLTPAADCVYLRVLKLYDRYVRFALSVEGRALNIYSIIILHSHATL